jgi:hypothetical protein
VRALSPAAPGLAILARAVAVVVVAAGAATACRPDPVVGSLRTPARSIRLGYPETVPLRLEWTTTAPLVDPAGNPTVFVHLLDEQGGVRRTFDHPFPEDWNPGRAVAYDIDLYQSALAPALPKGRYVLTAGLYDPPRQSRWRLDAAAESGKREYRLAEVEVVEASDPAPFFEFSGAWGPPEPDASLQILSRRRLMGPAVLAFTGAGGGGTVRLALTVKGAPLPVSSECLAPAGASGNATRLDLGYRWIDLAAAPSRRCEIRFAATPGVPVGQTSTLDIAAIRPGGSR